MLDFFKNILFGNSLKKRCGSIKTALLPLEEVRNVVLLIDASKADFADAENIFKVFFESQGINFTTYGLDLGKKPLAASQRALLKSDFTKTEKLKDHKIEEINALNSDLFISTIDSDNFRTEYIAACVSARFKVGRRQVRGHYFDLVVKDPPENGFSSAGDDFNQVAAAKNIVYLLTKIRKS